MWPSMSPPAGKAPSASHAQLTESVAPGSAAGFIFQFERALARLAEAESYAVEVGIEAIDDIAVRDAQELLLLEQNKHTVAADALTDRCTACGRPCTFGQRADTQPPNCFWSQTVP